MSIKAVTTSESNKPSFFSKNKEEILFAAFLTAVAVAAIGVGLMISGRMGVQATNVQSQALDPYRQAIARHEWISHATSNPLRPISYICPYQGYGQHLYPSIPSLSGQAVEFEHMFLTGEAFTLVGGVSAVALGVLLFKVKRSPIQKKSKLDAKEIAFFSCMIIGLAVLALGSGFSFGGNMGTYAMSHSNYNPLFSQSELFRNNMLTPSGVRLPTLDSLKVELIMSTQQFQNLTMAGYGLQILGAISMIACGILLTPSKKRSKSEEWIEMERLGVLTHRIDKT